MSQPDPLPPSGTALQPAAKIVSDATGGEEARFNNLNNRGIALISASSLVTALIGVFAKDLLGTTYQPVRVLVAIALIATVVVLVAAIGTVIVGVLIPSRRVIFGDNRIVWNSPALVDDSDVYAIQWLEYRQILTLLQARNAKKANAIHVGYWLYGTAAFFGSIAVVLVLGFSFSL